MKKKLLFLACAFVSTLGFSQVPSYVPTNGLVAYYPFNGNANDESGNSNNGTVNGATLSTDRFGENNKAYSFYQNNDYINISTVSGDFDSQEYTISYWFKSNQAASNPLGGPNVNPAVISRLNTGGPQSNPPASIDNFVIYEINGSNHLNSPGGGGATGINTVLGNEWHYIVFTKDADSVRTYLDGEKIKSILSTPINYQPYPIRLGKSQYTYWKDFSGELDDLAFYNRALSDEEIIGLYTSCNLNPSINASSTTLGQDANLTVASNDVNAVYTWQTNVAGLDWMNVPNNNKYSAPSANELSISSLQLANHLQEFRVIASAGNCLDTSDVKVLDITDTCFVTVEDTLNIYLSQIITSVYNSSEAATTIKVFPNPTNQNLTIEIDNPNNISGVIFKVLNAQSSEVYNEAVTGSIQTIDVSSWSPGIYFLHVINGNNTLEIRKIVVNN